MIKKLQTHSISNVFNDYFATVGTNLAKTIPNTDYSYMDYIKTPSILNSFYISLVSAEEIETEIGNL